MPSSGRARYADPHRVSTLSERDPSARGRAEDVFHRWLELAREPTPPDPAQLLAGESEEVRREFQRILSDYEALRAAFGTTRTALAAGRRLGGFVLVRELGRGSTGSVWEAEQPALGRRVALKVLHAHLSFSEASLERFRREAIAGGSLSHPAIVAVHEVGEADGLHYIAQELVPDGRSLAEEIAALRASPSPPPRERDRAVARRFADLAEALAAAHERGIVHRDLKPGNVLIDARGAVKVADFGLAKVQDDLLLSRSGEVLGTPYYMSPEQASGPRDRVGPRSDVFSLGATLYEALALERPFRGDDVREVFAAICLADPPDPRRLRPAVPRDLAVICLRALEKRPEKRYSSMAELAADLRRYLAHEPIRARPPGPLGRGLRWCRRHPARALSATVLTGALLVLAFAVDRFLDSRRTLAAAADLLLGALEAYDEGDAAERRSVAAELEDFARAQLEDDPRRRIRTLSRAAHLWAAGGAPREAARLLPNVLEESIREHGELSDEAFDALASLVDCLGELDRFEEAAEYAERGLEKLERRDDPGDERALPLLAALWLGHLRAQDPEGLARSRARWGELEERLLEQASVPDAVDAAVALAELHFHQERYAEAERSAGRAIGRLRRLLAGGDRRLLALELQRAAAAQRQDGRRGELAALVESLAACRAALPPDDHLVGRAEWYVGRAYLDEQRLAQAYEHYRSASEVLARALDPGHMDALNARLGLGLVQRELGRAREALAVIDGVVAGFCSRYGPCHTETLIAERAGINVLWDLGEWEERERRLRDVLPRYAEAGHGRGEDARTTRSQLADTLLELGRAEEAIAEIQDLLDICPADDVERARYEIQLGAALREAGYTSASRELLERVLVAPVAGTERGFGVPLCLELGRTVAREGDLEAAIERLEDGLAQAACSSPDGYVEIACELASVLHGAGRCGEARALEREIQGTPEHRPRILARRARAFAPCR